MWPLACRRWRAVSLPLVEDAGSTPRQGKAARPFDNSFAPWSPAGSGRISIQHSGTDGNDLLSGGDGNDILRGHAGNDLLDGEIKVIGLTPTWGKEELSRWKNAMTGEISYSPSNPGDGPWMREVYATHSKVTLGNETAGPVYWHVLLEGYAGGLWWDSASQSLIGL